MLHLAYVTLFQELKNGGYGKEEQSYVIIIVKILLNMLR